MNMKEFALLAAAIRTYYPKESILPNQQAMELWYNQLKDIPYEVAEASLNAYVSLNKWSPTIADIREMVSTVQHGNIPDWGEGWEQVLKAIRMFGMYRVEEAMNSFDTITRQCVERLGFKNICMSENINHDRANFRMIYEQLQERKKRDAQIALPLRELIQGIQQKGAAQIEGNKLLETN